MSEIKEIIIKEIEHNITKNGDIMTTIHIEGQKPLLVFGFSEFLTTRQKNDKLKYSINGGKIQVQVPKAFTDIYSADNAVGKLFRRVNNNFRVALDRAKNGEKIELSMDETVNYVKEQLTEKMLFADIITDFINESDSNFAKELVSESKLKKATRKFDPETIISYLSNDVYKEYKRSYKIADVGF